MATVLAGSLAVAGDGGLNEIGEATKEMKQGVTPELERLREACLEWPDETRKCLSEPLYLAYHQEECEDAIAVAFGETPEPRDVPEGPAPAWSYAFGSKPASVLLQPDGLVVGGGRGPAGIQPRVSRNLRNQGWGAGLEARRGVRGRCAQAFCGRCGRAARSGTRSGGARKRRGAVDVESPSCSKGPVPTVDCDLRCALR